MICPPSSLLLAPRVSTDLALPGSKYYRVIPHLCGIPAVWRATEIQSEVSTHSESEKGANTWVLAIHAAVLSGLTTTAAYLPCQQKLLSKHSPRTSSYTIMVCTLSYSWSCNYFHLHFVCWRAQSQTQLELGVAADGLWAHTTSLAAVVDVDGGQKSRWSLGGDCNLVLKPPFGSSFSSQRKAWPAFTLPMIVQAPK